MSQITTTAGQQKPDKCLNVKGKIFFHANHSLTIVEQCVGDWPILLNIKQICMNVLYLMPCLAPEINQQVKKTSARERVEYFT